ncbi:TNF receptor-associated factor 6-like isoform X5 [Oopsacas minuta]|uniref:TNF receptor-associated factor 6-like isoform X5 n=1 Tax=Oopsacas minuta TaxID=111878 RepID=A0AAV7K9J4_9METZ|nr:TNF receptor-associated factor 6-like isoform X5 [Oopsacas minuta]
MTEGEANNADDINDILFVTNSRHGTGSHYGYRKDYLEEQLNELAGNFLTCPNCDGIMREACVREGKITCRSCNRSPHMADPVDLVRNSVLTLSIKCPLLRGCDWKGKLMEAIAHVGTCPNLRQLCPLLCGSVIERDAMVNHTEQVCPLHDVKCDFCDETVKYLEITGHMVNCMFRPMNCECGKELCRNEYVMHIGDECPLAEVDCPYAKYSCHIGKILRKDLLDHKKEFYIEHQDMLEAENSKLILQVNALSTKLKFKKDMEYVEFNLHTDIEGDNEGPIFISGNSRFKTFAIIGESLIIQLCNSGRNLFSDNHSTHCQLLISMPDNEFDLHHEEYTVANNEVDRKRRDLFAIHKDTYSKYIQQDDSLTFRMYYESKV